MPQAKVEAKTRITHHGSRWAIIAQLHNVSTSPALMVRVKAVRAKTGDPILPALYNDNYIALMPGERKSISVELEDADTRGEKPRDHGGRLQPDERKVALALEAAAIPLCKLGASFIGALTELEQRITRGRGRLERRRTSE